MYIISILTEKFSLTMCAKIEMVMASILQFNIFPFPDIGADLLDLSGTTHMTIEGKGFQTEDVRRNANHGVTQTYIPTLFSDIF